MYTFFVWEQIWKKWPYIPIADCIPLSQSFIPTLIFKDEICFDSEEAEGFDYFTHTYTPRQKTEILLCVLVAYN